VEEMNIIVIVSDTFRRDHLGCYGNKDIRTPNLDRFAQKCVKFNRCYATSFPTMPCRADLFTGRYTFRYLGWGPLPKDEKTLAEILEEKGYTSIAVVDTPFFIRNGYGYDRGFSEFIWISGQRIRGWMGKSSEVQQKRVDLSRRYEEDFFAPKTMNTAEKLLEEYHKKRFFLYVDTWDPHEPWDPPEWYVKLYYSDYGGQIIEPCYWEWRERGVEEEEIKIAHACYCGEITMVDRWIGRLLEKVELLGLLDNTVIVFTSDHGYYFGEHGYFGKARNKWLEKEWYWSPLYEEVARVPLLIYVPKMKPRETDALVSLVDLMPTVLDLAGVDIPTSVESLSLVPVIKGEKDNLRDFVITSWPLYNPNDKAKVIDDSLRNIKEPMPSTITTRKWSLVYTGFGYPTELYDLQSDPNQTTNVLWENRSIAENLHCKFITLLEQLGTEERILEPRRKISE